LKFTAISRYLILSLHLKRNNQDKQKTLFSPTS